MLHVEPGGEGNIAGAENFVIHVTVRRLGQHDSGFLGENFVVFEIRLGKLVAGIEIVEPYYCVTEPARKRGHFALSVVVVDAVVDKNVPVLRLYRLDGELE